MPGTGLLGNVWSFLEEEIEDLEEGERLEEWSDWIRSVRFAAEFPDVGSGREVLWEAEPERTPEREFISDFASEAGVGDQLSGKEKIVMSL